MEDLSVLAPNLRRHERGFWCTEESARVSYPEGAHDGYYRFEESSFWFRHRNHCITALVGEHPPPNEGTIYDVGGGNGIVSLALQHAGS